MNLDNTALTGGCSGLTKEHDLFEEVYVSTQTLRWSKPTRIKFAPTSSTPNALAPASHRPVHKVSSVARRRGHKSSTSRGAARVPIVNTYKLAHAPLINPRECVFSGEEKKSPHPLMRKGLPISSASFELRIICVLRVFCFTRLD